MNRSARPHRPYPQGRRLTSGISVRPPTASRSTRVRAYLALTKPRIMLLLLLTTAAAALIADRQHPLPLGTLARVLPATLLGGALASGGAAALNCYLDRDMDAVMTRTRRRTLPSGLLRPGQVLLFGTALILCAALVLLVLVNPLAAALALAGAFYYVVIYTLWLKRRTRQNIVIGGGAGALPPLVGWAAVTDGISLPAALLCVIIVLWTPAHFWALALLHRRDYAAVGVPMLPVVAGEPATRRLILLYTVLVVGASLTLYAVGAMGLLYLAAALALGGWFIYRACRVLRDAAAREARRLFLTSNLYLALLFVAMVIDRVVAP